MDVKGKVALVTGGGKRVGRAMVLALARAGMDIVLHYRSSEDEARATAAEVQAAGRKCWLLQADLANLEELDALLRSIGRDTPEVDVLVNSASVFFPTPLRELDAKAWDNVFAVNLRAPMLLSRELGLRMRERGHGKIINLTDALVRRPYSNHAAYLVSKAGLESLTQVLAVELAPQVQVNAIAPGTVELPENSPPERREQIIRHTPLRRIGSPDDVAKMVVHLVLHGDFMTGGTYTVDGGAWLRR